MIASMTGFGKGVFTQNNLTVTTEIRSVNNRFNEISLKTPKMLQNRENDLKNIIREKIGRGKINVFISFNEEYENKSQLKVNEVAAMNSLKLLKDLKKVTKIKENIKLDHLITFSEIFESLDENSDDSFAFSATVESLNLALNDLMTMRENEGKFLQVDLQKRIANLEKTLDEIEQISKNKIPDERERIRNKVKEILNSDTIDENRIEMEIVLLADKLDVTEECVRFKSHNIFFNKCLENNEQSGRKLNFLIQEMNREINTIGAKANDSTISHLVVEVKEELEKIREQLQNIE